MTYQWFPGHMTKAFRMMQEDIKLMDLVIELLDSRIPYASQNPDIDKLAQGKARMVILNKADLADGASTKLWTDHFHDLGYTVVTVNSRTKEGINRIIPSIQNACKEKIEKDLKKGIKNRPIRAMIVGIPNVGKSTFINSLAGKAAAKTGNKPGVTKGKQWIRLNKNIELLDTPGVLWPKFEDPVTGRLLAFIGSINDEIIDINELAFDFIEYIKCLKYDYYKMIGDRYGVSTDKKSYELIKDIAIERKCLLKGGEPDVLRASRLLIDDFRNGKLGEITLELP
ncbi:MAG: ribosome biogenesis GTPase YlqF [Lachnospiraceae bacterium]|nr:ribosome biogenesis GTPase YlqF [Lachnospiraceae bacterium]